MQSQTLFLLTILFLGGTIGAPAQTKSGSGGQSCKVNSVEFLCPKGFSVLTKGDQKEPFVAIDSKSRVGLFASELMAAPSDVELIPATLDIVFLKLFSTTYHQSERKESPDFWGSDKYSLFEESKMGKAALTPDGKFIHIHYVILKTPSGRLLVGFTDVMGVGKEAEQHFQNWQGGGGDGDSQLQSLVLSITGEKQPSLTPGGPPPAAAPSNRSGV